jgi:hypothetical protein
MLDLVMFVCTISAKTNAPHGGSVWPSFAQDREEALE